MEMVAQLLVSKNKVGHVMEQALVYAVRFVEMENELEVKCVMMEIT